jgi:3'(2'), 5'-bisphosphate nucleotidase
MVRRAMDRQDQLSIPPDRKAICALRGAPVLELIEDPAWISQISQLSRVAGEAILKVYQQESFNISHKLDESPITQADLAANQVIVEGLASLAPEIPILSEESELVGYDQRRHWRTYWLIDPLDGTREFIDRNGEFTVNIALIHSGVPVMGIVYVPVQELLYVGVQVLVSADPDRLDPLIDRSRSYAFKQLGTGEPEFMHAARLVDLSCLTVVASRRHGNEAFNNCLLQLKKSFSRIDTTQIGSSLKICLLAEGAADLYPRLAPTCEWDTAAAQAILEAAGGSILDDHFAPLRYNTKESMLNPDFFAVADNSCDWQSWLEG